jgi:hypothetical protein
VQQVRESRDRWSAPVVDGLHRERRGHLRRRRGRQKRRRYLGRHLGRGGGCVEQNYGEKSCESGKMAGASLEWLVNFGRLHGRLRHVFAPGVESVSTDKEKRHVWQNVHARSWKRTLWLFAQWSFARDQAV